MRWLIGAALFLTSPAAHAHMLNTGLGPFYDGLAHLFVTPEDMLPVIAIALLGGLRGANFGRTLLFVLPVAWLAGSFAGRFSPVPLTLPVLTAALTVILGGLVAADRPLSVTLVAGCGLLLGLLHGLLNGSEFAKQHAIISSSVGVSVALFVVVSLLAGQVTTVRAAWARLAVRVAGSWIAATGLLMLGWTLRGSFAFN
ncbi:MAG: HupE/UreJ family protein [Terrimicrobiaceae bacterium]